jgi:integrase
MTALAQIDRVDKSLQYLSGIKDSYTSSARSFLEYASQHEEGISVPALGDYFYHLGTMGYLASTVRLKRHSAINRLRKIASIPGATTPEQRARLEWAIDEINKAYPAPKLQFDSVGEEKVMSTKEYLTTLDRCKSDRQKGFIRFLYTTGCRVAEMRGIRLNHCKVINEIVYISVLGKGSKERTVRIQEAMYNDIRATFKGQVYLFETQMGKPYNCSYVSTEIRKVTKKAIGKSLSAHKMRHSWATRKIGSGVPVDAVSRYMGHSSTAITLKYYAHNQITNDQLFDEAL